MPSARRRVTVTAERHAGATAPRATCDPVAQDGRGASTIDAGRHVTRRRLLAAGVGVLAMPASLWSREEDPRFQPVLPRHPTLSGPDEHDRGEALRGLGERASEIDALRAIIVSRHGETLFAEGYAGTDLDRPVNVKSVSKSLLSLLAGRLIDAGLLDAVDRRLGELAPQLIPDAATPVVPDLRLADLLSMQAGLERTSGPFYGEWVTSPDWVAYVLTRPQIAPVGGRMLYSTGNYHVAGAVLASLAGEDLHRLFVRHLGDPLDVELPPWTRDPQGRYLGGNEMAMSPRGLWRVGEMMRRGGVHDDRRIVSTGWIETSTRPRTRSPYSGHDYGYGWFVARIGRERVIYARGYGGQLLYVMPSRGITAVMLSDPLRPARSGGHTGLLHDLFANHVVAALPAGAR